MLKNDLFRSHFFAIQSYDFTKYEDLVKNVDRPFITVGSTMTDTLPVDIFPPQRRLHHFIDI